MFTSRFAVAGLPLLAATLVVGIPSQAAAQDVQYETVTKTSLPGALGTAARLAARLGGGSMEVVEQTSIKGQRMRVDSDESSTITDFENGRIIYLDHAARTYSSYTFEEMIEQTRKTAAEMQAGNSQRTVSGDDAASGRVDFSVSVDDARQREQVAGYDAQRFFLTMKAETEYVPENATEREDGGTLVVLTDMWTSKDVPVFAARSRFDQTTAQEFAAAGAALTEGIAAAFADDPQLRVAFQKSAEEAKKMEGMPVRTVMHFVVVAPGKSFDRDAITNPQSAGSAAGAAASAAVGAAAGAARAGLSRLGGRFGRGGQQEETEPAAPAEEPSQSLMLTVTSEVRNVRTAPLDGNLFEVPAGYTEIKH